MFHPFWIHLIFDFGSVILIIHSGFILPQQPGVTVHRLSLVLMGIRDYYLLQPLLLPTGSATSLKSNLQVEIDHSERVLPFSQVSCGNDVPQG